MTIQRGWHFVRADRRLGYGDGREVRVGETITHDGPVELCKKGLHASLRVVDALSYAPGLVLCEVEIDVVVEGNDKVVGRSRKVLRMIDATKVMVDFAQICADRAKARAASHASHACAAAYAASAAAYAAADAAYAAAAAYAAYAAADAASAYASAAAYAASAAAYAAADAAERETQEKILLGLVELAFSLDVTVPVG